MVTVLVADNDAGVRALLVEVVRRQGCAVEAAVDGEAARARLVAGGIDVLVCDLDMPRLSGNDLLAWIELQPTRPAVLVVSGYIDARLEASLARLGCVRAVLRKPFDVLAFAQRVRAIAAAVAPPPPVAAPASAAAVATDAGAATDRGVDQELGAPTPLPRPDRPLSATPTASSAAAVDVPPTGGSGAGVAAAE